MLIFTIMTLTAFQYLDFLDETDEDINIYDFLISLL